MCNLYAKNVNQLNTRNGKKTKIVTFHTLTEDEKNSDMNTNDNLTWTSETKSIKEKDHTLMKGS